MKYYYKVEDLCPDISQIITPNDNLEGILYYKQYQDDYGKSMVETLITEGFSDFDRVADEGTVVINCITANDLMCVLDFYSSNRWQCKPKIIVKYKSNEITLKQVFTNPPVIGRTIEKDEMYLTHHIA
jgi:hypothetical protein